MRRATLHGPLRLLPRQESVDQAGRKRVPSPHAVKNLQVLSILRLVEFPIAITNRAPIVQRRSFSFPQRRGHHLERIRLHHLANHLLEPFDFKRRQVLIHPRYLIAQRRREIFLIPKHHTDMWRNLPVHLLRLLLSAQRFPEGCPIVEVIRDDRAVFSSRLHRFQRHLRRRPGKRAENSASVKPPRPLLSKNLVPINVPGLQLRYRRVPTVVASQRRAHSKSALRKIQPVARRATYTVMLHPSQQRLVHSSLINQILQQPPHRIIAQRRHHRRVQPEAALQPARHVVFPAALAHSKASRRRNSPLAGIESHHHLAQTHQVPAAFFLRLNRQRHALSSTQPRNTPLA